MPPGQLPAHELADVPLPTRHALLAATDELRQPWTRLLHAAADPAAPVPGLRWTVGETAAHVVSTLEAYAEVLRGNGSPQRSLDRAAIARTNEAMLAAVVDRRPAGLAERFGAALADFRAEIERADPAVPVPYVAGIEVEPACPAGLMVGELAVHGHDLARALRRSWRITVGAADAFVSGAAPLVPLTVDAAAAAGFTATFRLQLRGGGTYVFRFADGVLRVGAGWTGPVDCRISADPTAYMLSVYRRGGRLRPVLTGKVFTYGRRPWRALRFARVSVPP